MKSIFYFALIFLFCMSICFQTIFCQTDKSKNDQLTVDLNSYLKAQVANGFTGAVIVGHNGKTVIDGTYGLPENSSRFPAFWLASNSKPILAAAIFKLQEEGRLSVNDPITRFFKNVPADKQEITIRHLLTHTSGLPHQYVAEGIIDRDQAVQAVLNIPLEWKIGEGWHYANTNFYLLAAVVEIASKKSFEDYLQREIFDPAEMKNTGFWGFQKNVSFASMPNPMLLNKLKPTIYKDGKSVANWGYRGATGLFSTTEDLYKLLETLRNEKILTKKSLEQMWSPEVFIRHDPQTDVYSGFGWYVVTDKNGRRIAVRHTGSEDAIGHNGVIWAYENGDIMIVLSNAGEKNGQGVSGAVSSGLNKILSAE